jgi:hypothetical protein
MQPERVATSVNKPRYRAFSEHANVEEKLSSRQMAAVLRCRTDVGRLCLDHSRVESTAGVGIRLPRRLDAVLRDQ